MPCILHQLFQFVSPSLVDMSEKPAEKAGDETKKSTEADEDATAPLGAGVIDDSTKATVQKIPMLTVRAGPRDGDEWIKRQKQELQALIKVLLVLCFHP